MKVSIIVGDSLVIIDGVARQVSMADVLPGVHAVQWSGKTGEVELMAPQRENVLIDDLSPYQFLLDRWTAADPLLIPPPPPPTKDELLARTLTDPTLAAFVAVVATRVGITEQQMRDAIKARMT